VLGAAEGDDHRPLGPDLRHALALDEDRDIALGPGEHRAHVALRDALAEQRPVAVDQEQVDLLARGELDDVVAYVR
jgi:hypothetical protein